MKHPHPGRIAEVYRKTAEGYRYVGYTAGPFSEKGLTVHPELSHTQYADAKWNEELQGWVLPQRQRPVIND